MERGVSLSSETACPRPKTRDIDEITRRIKAELCEQWIPCRVERWGPTCSEENLSPSWTDTITTRIGGAVHYITCHGHHDSEPCVGSWSRRNRHIATSGIHCVYGDWVYYNGDTITPVPRSPENATANGERKLPHLRRLWAEHILSTSISQNTADEFEPVSSFLDRNTLERFHDMVEKAITQQVKEVCGRDNACSGSEKMLGKGYGGWTGISKAGIVLKRDAGNRRVGNHREQYGTDPGGVWQPGDLEVWIAWYGWSCLCCRDSRWKPGYHLVLHLANLAAAIDYAVTREVFRDWKADWMRASEWLWLNMPVDITGDCANILSGELMEIVHSEEERIYNLNPEVYVPHDANTTAKRYKLLQDRFAGCIAHHAVGEGLQTPRGLAAGWAMCVLNDIGDYERDLLCGERNNLVRSLTSDQQVIDAAAWILKILHWSFKSHDYDLADAILGTNTFNFFLWRYNLQKMAMYEAIGIRNSRPAEPLELQDIAEIVQSNIPGAAGNGGEPYFYGELYDNIKEDVERLYWGCTCSNPCEGHDAWKLFAQAMDEAGNDDIEERLLISLVQLDSGANDGDLSCECALDLLLYEGFVRFFDPETGIVARMHYRSGNMELGNTITE